ncbi:hypothetical protein RHGRI_027214 [Rhododendron griersonianum]|uniref:F-box domain-containing protein n=1 Tax=Rhododendron griersonianum TaxID=479676 RepID=A0AAV6IZB2_9ERIC|nr:hypothetical protein RHGRI_027214 [Rhododendron griersonianum]
MEWGRTEVTETEQKTRFPDVPEEIILRILLELPIWYLLRFRCVSKCWCFLISDPPFSLSVQRRHVIVASHYYQPEFSLRCINDDGSIMEIPRPKPLQFAGCLRIGGSCNGLVLLNYREDLFMWNPFTGCCKKRKIVSCALVNERLHWLVTESNIREDPFSLVTNLIVCFVPQTNKFVKVPMPDCDGTREHTYELGFNKGFFDRLGNLNKVGLGALNGYLSLVRCRNNKMFYDIEVLVMKQYGEKEYWTSLFIIPEFIGGCFEGKLVPLCCIKDMVLLLHSGPKIDVIVAWDLNKNRKGFFQSLMTVHILTLL